MDGAWRDAAALELTGDVTLGVQASTYLAYLPDYIIKFLNRKDAAALSALIPVDLAAHASNTWPAPLVDLLPQGYGREELLKQLERPEHAGPAADWELLCAGAGNPIGNARVKEAHEWIMKRSGGITRGFTFDEVAHRAGDFNEYLAQHGLFLAGSSGVQGEWPKILLTQAKDGLLYLDHMLPDEEAAMHYIVKFGKGTSPRLDAILRLEAPYMKLAKHLGLAVHADLHLRERALFIPRFDREVRDDAVLRLAQESAASLCRRAGFGIRVSNNRVCEAIGQVCTDPAREIIEFVKRDIANVALGNTDNHSRNTAFVRRPDGFIGMTPLFDFAPMWLHPDGIARIGRWDDDDHGSPNWASAIKQACLAAEIDAIHVTRAVKQMVVPMRTVFQVARELEIEDEFLVPLQLKVKNVLDQLEALDG